MGLEREATLESANESPLPRAAACDDRRNDSTDGKRVIVQPGSLP
jgi:hypothetical protein